MNKKFEQDLFYMEISVTLYMSLLSLLINLMHSCWIKTEIKMFYIYCVKYLNGSASQFPQKYQVFSVLIIRNVSWVLKQHYDDNFWRIMWHWRLAAENAACHHRNTFNFEIYPLNCIIFNKITVLYSYFDEIIVFFSRLNVEINSCPSYLSIFRHVCG